MIDGLFIIALLGAFYAEKHGSWAARGLIASTAVSSALIAAGVRFDLSLWMMLDVGVIGAIELGRIGAKERGVIALFAPAFVLYHTQPPGWADWLTLIVSAQLLLTVPWDRLGERLTWKAGVA